MRRKPGPRGGSLPRGMALVFLLLCTLAGAAAQAKGEGLIEGSGWAYLYKVPAGFKVDMRTLARAGISGLFYRSEQSAYDEAGLAITIQPLSKGPGLPADLDALVKWDQTSLLAADPGLEIRYYKDVELGDLSACRLFLVDDALRSRHSCRGYLSDHGTSFVFTLAARSAEERKANEESFLELLESFVYIEKE